MFSFCWNDYAGLSLDACPRPGFSFFFYFIVRGVNLVFNSIKNSLGGHNTLKSKSIFYCLLPRRSKANFASAYFFACGLKISPPPASMSAVSRVPGSVCGIEAALQVADRSANSCSLYPPPAELAGAVPMLQKKSCSSARPKNAFAAACFHCRLLQT